MRRIINGVVYDTDTSERLARGDHGDDRSDASWTLYRTPTGVFFELVAGHDGVLEGFFPLTDQEARKFLERHANDRVEEYLGPAREAARPLFSRRTIIAAADVLESLTQAEISALLTDFGPSVYEHIGGGSAKARMVELKRFIDRNPRHSVDDGLLENVLVERATARLPAIEPDYEWSTARVERPEFQKLRYALEQDGYRIVDGTLRRSLPSDIGLPQTDSELVALLKKHRFETSLGHLVQAQDAHARGNWASANAQLRSFFEGLLNEIATGLDAKVEELKESENKRAYLAKVGFLAEDLNEWGSNGKNFTNGLLRRLHPEGSHPGLSDKDDSTYRLHLVLLTAALLMRRYDGWPRT
ncbi:hypothetical protein LB554_20630 [Mesorhizobium sp. CO1-1-11]|uniref:hypothetical protein n=1 Tax=Mesorhizobium sp. CO1-1-11 TaxID=2876636 RepID=UPI001CCB8BD4|nr:hypothetical protein [Mesorhizobium sp. CO1-1-11]MBZ9726352.1 hypothetical protein [Mesorhizobium sp. CO1-1-11]